MSADSIKPRKSIDFGGWPSPISVLRGVGTFLAPVALAVISWLGMDWIEGRVLLANTVQVVKVVKADMDALKAESKADIKAQQQVQMQLFENGHKTDMAIQRITDLLASHDKEIGNNEQDIRDLRRGDRRARRGED